MLAFIEKFFRKSKYRSATDPSIFDKAPFLSHWYFDELKPLLVKENQLLRWEFLEKIRREYVAIMILRDSSEKILGLVNTYNYVHPSVDNSQFLIWDRGLNKTKGTQSLTIELFDVEKLSPIVVNNHEMIEFNKNQKRYVFSEPCALSISYEIDPLLNEQSFVFPIKFKSFASFFAVVDYEGLYDEEKFGNTLLLEFDPKNDLVRHFPQDWLNKSDADLLYQWITRAVRDNKGVIHGQGVRLDNFILDDSGCNLR